MKTLTILGSTGSIGVSTLDVVGAHPGEFTVAALAAGRNVALLKLQIDRFRPRLAAVAEEEDARALRQSLGPDSPTAVLAGAEGYREAASYRQTDMVVSAMVGSVGLRPTVDAIEARKDIALANKESLVMAGAIMRQKARERGVSIIPIDSEHSAVFQCLQGQARKSVRRIILTASGGPFLSASPEELAAVTPAQALRHPNWMMGKKITIDSATMMNKGLEVIEAGWLFDLPVSSIDVLIHPQSIVHSLVEFHDGSVIAQLGAPDMRVPIAYALSYPNRLPRTEPLLDLAAVGTLTFSRPNPERFPSLSLAYRAARAGGTMPAVMNGANEVGVTAFIDSKIRFTDIYCVVAGVLDRHRVREEPGIDDIWVADRWAREEAERIVKGISN